MKRRPVEASSPVAKVAVLDEGAGDRPEASSQVAKVAILDSGACGYDCHEATGPMASVVTLGQGALGGGRFEAASDEFLRTATTKSGCSTRSSFSLGRPASRDSVAPGTEMGLDPLEDRLCRQSHETLAALDRARRALDPSEVHVTDFVLLRFLKCNHLDLEASLRQFRRRLQWEKDEKLEDLVAGAEPEMATLEECYPQGWHGVDRYGRPVKIERLGQLDTQRLACPEIVTLAKRRCLLDGEMLLREKFPACSLAAGHLVHRFTNIIDLQGLSFHTASDPQCRALIKQLLVTSKLYFPEALGKTIIVNAPRIFSISWSALKSSLDQAVLDRIEIVGQDPRKVRAKLLQIIEPDQLPSFLGGQCTCSQCSQGCLGSAKGPWSDPAIRAEVARTSHHELIERFAVDSSVEEPRALASAGPGDATLSSTSEATVEARGGCVARPAGDPVACRVGGFEGGAAESLSAALAALQEAHQKSLQDWVVEAVRLERELGLKTIERAAPYYEVLHFLKTGKELLQKAEDRYREVDSEFEDSLLAVDAAKSTLSALVASKREEALPQLPEDIHNIICSKLTRAVDRSVELENQRELAQEEGQRCSRDLVRAKALHAMLHHDHRLCHFRCPISICKPFFEAKLKFETKINAEVQRIEELRSLVAEEAGQPSVPCREGSLHLCDFEVAVGDASVIEPEGIAAEGEHLQYLDGYPSMHFPKNSPEGEDRCGDCRFAAEAGDFNPPMGIVL